jgi:hypothetical protein
MWPKGWTSFDNKNSWSASTSTAVTKGLPMDVIVAAEDWSSARTFEKQYHKSSGTYPKGRYGYPSFLEH